MKKDWHLLRLVGWKWRVLIFCVLLLAAAYLGGWRYEVLPVPSDLRLMAVSAFAAERPASQTVVMFEFLLLALATLISEDLTCVWAGVLAAEGRISFAFASTACLFGIFIGDVLLFLAGRYLGRPVLRRAPLRWFVSDADVQRSSAWFRRRGLLAISLSRFLPGTRLPTYFAAGLLDTSLLKFTFYFLLAAIVWTPLLVGAAMLLGREIIESALMTDYLFLRLAIATVAILIIVRVLMRLTTFRGRRLLLGRWRRLARWEFWPPWLFYPPVLAYIVYLGLKHRCWSLFTCANPGIEEGGFVGESKSEILRRLGQTSASHSFIASWSLLRKELDHQRRLGMALQFMQDRALDYPVVLKPNAGERGAGVAVIKSESELDQYLSDATQNDVIIQEHIPGLEFGVFYYRFPHETHGEILSITRKLFPTVIGDGLSTLETLILKDPRAVCMARSYFSAQKERLFDVPAAGEEVRLIEIGTHCRGSIFLDGYEIKTDAMLAAIDRLAQGYAGFYFGRFDIRTPSLADFQQGQNFKVVELNGVTSEATHIYDPENSLLQAYRVLFQQWRLAFAIGAQNSRNGARPTSLRRLAGLLFARWNKKSERSEGLPRLIEVKSTPASNPAGEI